MKKLLLATVFAMLPVAVNAADVYTEYTFIDESVSPAPAHVGPTFLLEGYGGYNWIDTTDTAGVDDEDTDYWLYGGWAGINIPIAGASGIQLEIFGEGTTAEIMGGDPGYAWSAGGGAHAFWRDPSRGLLGVMGGAYYSNTGTDESDRNEAWAWLAGVEAQAYLGKTTLYGQAGYTTYVDVPADGSGQDEDYPKDVIFIRGVARQFVGDLTKLEGEVGGAFGRFDDQDADFYIVNWALEAEHAFAGGVPLSVFARYEGIYADHSDESDASLDTTVKVGLRGRFGGAADNLYFNDRNGVSLDLPDVGRWGGVLNGVIE